MRLPRVSSALRALAGLRPVRRAFLSLAVAAAVCLPVATLPGPSLPQAAAQDPSAQLEEWKADALLAMRGDGGGPERAHKLARLAEADSIESAKGFLECLDALAVKHDANEKGIRDVKKAYEPFSGWSFSDPSAWDVKKRLLDDMERLEAKLQSDGVVMQAAAVSIAKMRNPQGVALLEKAAGASSFPFSRAILFPGLLRNPGSKAAELLKKAAKDEDPTVRVAAFEAAGERKDPAVVDVLVKALQEKDWPIRRAVVAALGAQGDARAVPALIAAMQSEEGALLEDFTASLKALTGAQVGMFPDAWRKWYEDNKKVLEEKGVKGPTPKSGGKPEPSKLHYYGVETPSKKVLFIMDTSGSMKEPLGEDKGPVTGEKQEVFSGLKIEVAKRVLSKAIRNLPENAVFDVILFNHQVKPVFGQMLPASIENKNKAELAIEEAKPSGATWAYGALRQAFEIASKGVTEDQVHPSVDTIFLLSDGAPTDEDTEAAKPMEPKVILDAVAEWNRVYKVRIHTIAIDPRINGKTFVAFMRGLATAHGGTYTPIGSK